MEIKQNNYKKSLAILRANKVYRISDLFHRGGNRWRQDRRRILSKPKYADTILFNYLSNKRREEDYKCMRTAMKDISKEKKYERPAENELVIHLRLGDIFNPRTVADKRRPIQDAWRRYSRFFEKNDFGLDSLGKITVVTALHFGANEKTGRFFYSNSAKKESIKFLRMLEGQVNDVGHELNLISNEDIDRDICYMSGSMHYVKGLSGLSRLISKCLPRGSKVYGI